MINGRGAVYTVEEVSDLLGIPRPTLYRYLREYSISHLRKAGRISIPEDSFEKIRQARDLHKEGLGTETVRRMLREGTGSSETQKLTDRLDRVSRDLESLRGGLLRPSEEDLTARHALRTVLARQSLLISAIFNLTEMVEELLRKSGQQPRASAFGEPVMPERTVDPNPPETRLARSREIEPLAGEGDRDNLPTPREGRGSFGRFSRRRRRGAAVMLAALLAAPLLAWVVPVTGADRVFELRFPGPAQREDALLPAGSENSGRGARVPDVTGLTLERAEQQLEQAGLKPGSHREVISVDAPEGEVIAQSPSPQKSVHAGASVELTVSAGARAEIPDVAGRDMEEASRLLTGAGYEVVRDNFRIEQGPEPAGTVTRTIPPAGTEAGPETPVTLVVSLGQTS